MNTPSLHLEFPPTADEYRANIRRQKAIAFVIARKMRRGKSLQDWELAFAAAQLTARARELSEVMPNRKSRPAEHNHSELALEVVRLMRYENMGKTEAIKTVAMLHGIGDPHDDGASVVRYAWKQKGAAAEAYVWPMGKK